MPIYEYRCEKGHHFEAVQRMADDSLTACQVCGAPVQRVLFAPAVHFKGSGFYNTDYGTARRKRELESSANEGADKHDAKQDSKKESKPGADSGASKSKSESSSDSSAGSGNTESASSGAK
jgi:putative FmdB family regulatory protein